MRNPSLFEKIGEKVLLLLVGPLSGISALHARGRARFVVTRGVAYATVMTAGLVVLNTISGGPMFHAPLDVNLLVLRLGSYWGVQLVVGVVLSMFIWRMVERIAALRAKAGAGGPTG